ncbi:hypothetical protein E2C01_061583 [Portunus trituberculatus]|uniref:Uncharacterized protein n=1 Tax=Portunus trituberculatus TaxID=210409 RepID=A0A5B7HET2_PORTR|nr:hypothetical protein [Portunus trituberculatus]
MPEASSTQALTSTTLCNLSQRCPGAVLLCYGVLPRAFSRVLHRASGLATPGMNRASNPKASEVTTGGGDKEFFSWDDLSQCCRRLGQ